MTILDMLNWIAPHYNNVQATIASDSVAKVSQPQLMTPSYA